MQENNITLYYKGLHARNVCMLLPSNQQQMDIVLNKGKLDSYPPG